MRGTEFAELEAFVAIAEHRSFAKAAAQLGVSRSTLSQNLRSLEDRLGARLLNRTTRSVAPTDAGERLLVRARQPLRDLASAAQDVHDVSGTPTGVLRLVVQPPVASFLVGPILARFLEAYPSILVDISIAKLPVDIVSERFDAGIQLGEQVEKDMIALRVTGDAHFVAVASPRYLARRPRPTRPRDLVGHACIRARLPNAAIFGWEFRRGGKAMHVAVTGPLIVDDIDLVVRAALDGVGIGYLLRDYVAAPLADGRLVSVLDEWSPRLSGFFLYHPSGRQMTAALRAFVDFLRAEAHAKGIRLGNVPSTKRAPKHRLVRSLE